MDSVRDVCSVYIHDCECFKICEYIYYSAVSVYTVSVWESQWMCVCAVCLTCFSDVHESVVLCQALIVMMNSLWIQGS